jgi:hypothetical protein
MFIKESRMRKVWNAIVAYLNDWKNWLVHALIGVGLLLIALFLPVKPIYRIGILLLVIASTRPV